MTAVPIPMKIDSPSDIRLALIRDMANKVCQGLFDADDPVPPHEIAEKVVLTADYILARLGLASYDHLSKNVTQSDLETIHNKYPSGWRIFRVVRVHPLSFYHPGKNRVDFLSNEILKDTEGFKSTKVAFSICGHENGNGTKDGDQIYLFVTVWFEPK